MVLVFGGLWFGGHSSFFSCDVVSFCCIDFVEVAWSMCLELVQLFMLQIINQTLTLH
jgi:hypothetical protein